MTNESNVIVKTVPISLCLIAAALLPLSAVQSTELTGRVSVLGTTASAEPGDAGYDGADNDTFTADQQSLRLMLDDSRGRGEWSVHLKMVRQHLSGFPAGAHHSSDLFRYRDLADDWQQESSGDSSTRAGFEFDRAAYKRRFDRFTVTLGRQPIDWGSGRFWQPLNVFGAFAATDLDTDFKPGIDSLVLDWYPSAFSSLTAVHAWAPKDNTAIENSSVLHYRRQVGERVDVSLVAGQVIGNDVAGMSLEGDWAGMGWRVEWLHTHLQQPDESTDFWIAGIDYQFENGTLIAVEWYDNGRGATQEASLPVSPTDLLVTYGLQQHLVRRVLGIAVEKDITPLLHGGYTLLISPLNGADGHAATSVLHQFNLSYSVSNESDLLLSLQFANGPGLNQMGESQSEFGHLPMSLTVRLRFYF